MTTDSASDTETPKTEPEKQRGIGATLWSWTKQIALFVAVYLIITTFLARAYVVPTESMEPTIHGSPNQLEADRLFVEKVSRHFTTFEVGDIVVFDPPPEQDTDIPFVKRIVGGPGDHLRLHGGVLYVNGEPEEHLKELGLLYTPGGYDTRYNLSAGVEVPEDCYFLMGDNTNNSRDSRVFGPVKADSIIGKVIFRIWPPSRVGTVD
ncbi:MAG: signal peptidase I [Planctomycetota bacterium]